MGFCTLQVGDGGLDGSIGNGAISRRRNLTFLSATNITLTSQSPEAASLTKSGTGRLVFSGDPLNGFSGAMHNQWHRRDTIGQRRYPDEWNPWRSALLRQTQVVWS